MITIGVAPGRILKLAVPFDKHSHRHLSVAFRRIEIAFAKHFQEKHLRNRASTTESMHRRQRHLRRITGTLARGFRHQTNTGSHLDQLFTRWGWVDQNIARIARVHELGTVGAGGSMPDIRPRRASWLTIPMQPLALTPAGKRRRPSARDWSKAYVGPLFPGMPALWIRHMGKPVVLYLLVRSVAIPPRLMLGKSWVGWMVRGPGQGYLREAVRRILSSRR